MEIKPGDSVEVIRISKGSRKSKAKFKLGDIGEVRNIYRRNMVYVWFDVGICGAISSRNLEVVQR